jgi:hypothetical protein
MAKLAAAEAARVLLLGASGGGKTGMLASLAVAGYNLRILDFDNGTEILFHLLKSNPEALDRVDVEKCLDTYKQGGDKSVKWNTPTAFPHALKCLDNWPGLGKPSEWGLDTILVLDSGTFMGEAVMRYVLSANGKHGTSTDPKAGPTEPNWGSAIGLQEDFIAMLCGDQLKCHVIVTFHLKPVPVGGVEKPMPSALGKKFPPNVATYFNHALLANVVGSGAAQQRMLVTKPTGMIDLKSAAPASVKPEYPIATGMADYFKDVFGPLK